MLVNAIKAGTGRDLRAERASQEFADEVRAKASDGWTSHEEFFGR